MTPSYVSSPESAVMSDQPERPIVQWQLRRGRRFVTCRIASAGSTRAYEVATIPHWNVTRAIVEVFDALGPALCRHAAIATKLREAGWRVASYSALPRAGGGVSRAMAG
jgi:hypothetical protein